MKKTFSILGSTGSVGLASLSIIDKKKKNFRIGLLSANKNYSLICEQIKKYNPKFFVVNDFKIFTKVKKKLQNQKTLIFNNYRSIKSNFKSDISVCAIPGIIGLEPTILMTKLSRKILIANKESIICGWHLINEQAKKYKTKVIPVDSEHYSIWKLIEKYKINEINKIYITASGGPFLNHKRRQLKNITPKDALKHPKWKMGKKISIDSSTMMNKVLEIIEAQKLFNIPTKKLDVLIHPNSLVHAIVEFKNGLSKFIYHKTSMIIPLANAIFDGNLDIKDFYNKTKKDIYKDLDNLVFKKVDRNIFPIIGLKNRINEYPSTAIILNASNEILVDQFLKKKIPFLRINRIIKTILNDRNYKKYAIKKPKNLKQINDIDLWAKEKTMELIKLYHA